MLTKSKSTVLNKVKEKYRLTTNFSIGKKNGVTFFVGSPAQSPLSPGAAIRPPSICSDLLISASLSSYSIVRQPLQRALSCGAANGKRERNASGFNRRRSNSSRRSRTSILAEQTMPTIEEHDGASAVVAAELSNEQREQPKKMPNTVCNNQKQAERATLIVQQENEER